MLTNRYRSAGFAPWLILLFVLGSASSAARAQSNGAEFPLAIQRIIVKPANVSKELEKVQQGTLIPWTLQQLDARLDRVRKATQTREAKPRLTQAKYSAELIGAAFAQGNGQWLIQNPGADALLPIETLNLALANLRWEQGNDALLGEFDGKSLSLLVPTRFKAAAKGPAQTCIFDWSSRGVPSNEGLAFSLIVPACPITTFDLKLPGESWLAAPKKTVLVHGPLDSGSPNHRLWKVHAAGQTHIDLIVRKISEPKGTAPTLFARVQSVQALDRDRITLSHEFQVDILHGSITELYLESEHALQPIDVSIKSGEIKRWQWLENGSRKDAKGKSIAPLGVLKIEFHEPVQGKLQGLRVRSLALTPSIPPLLKGAKEGIEWVSPELRVRNAISRGELLQLQFHPDLPVGKWDAGTFQHLQIATDIDGRQTLTLADTAANAEASRRPVLRLERATTEVHTKEDFVWQITPGGATLHAEISYLPSRGSLFEMAVKLPKAFMNYSIDSLELLPVELLRRWHLQGDTLIVELKQALTPTKKAVVKIQFRHTLPAIPSGARTLTFPEVEPADATRREGVVTVRVDQALHAQLLNSSLPPSGNAATNLDKTQPAPSFHFSFRDQRFSAAVRVAPLPAQVQARGKHVVRLTESHATLTSHWDVEPIAGEPSYLDFQGSPGFPLTWKLLPDETSLKVHHWERLHAQEALPSLLFFGMPSAMHAVALHSVLPTGPRWRFYLTEPLRKPASITIEATLTPGMPEDEWRRLALRMPNVQPWQHLCAGLAADLLRTTASSKHWRVPLMAPLQRAEIDHEFVIESPNEPIEQYTTRGLGHLSALAAPTASSPVQSLTLHASSQTPFAQPELTLITRSEKRAASMLGFCDEAVVTTFVHPDGRIDHRVRLRLWHWHDRNCTIGFPAGSQIAAVKVHDQWLDRVDVEEHGKGMRVTLPVDQNVESIWYEIYLRSQTGDQFVPGLFSIRIPHIDWPVNPLRVKTRLCLAQNLAPLHHEALASIGTPERFAGSSATWRWLRSLWTTGQSWFPTDEQTQSLQKLDQQRNAVFLAAKQFGDKHAGATKLGEALEIFALHHLKDQCPLVIDQTALRSLRLCSDTVVPASRQTGRPFWESLGLIYVPGRNGALLTSPRRLREFGVDAPADVDSLTPALREAILHGQDSSASFASVLSWLKSSAPEGCASSDAKGYAIAEDTGDFQDMTQWRVLGDEPHDLHVLVLERWTARIVGWIIAALLAVTLVFFHRRLNAVACTRMDLLILAFTLLLAIWAPANLGENLILPSIGVETACVVWGLICLFGQRKEIVASSASTVSKLAASVAVMLLFLFGIAFGASAQPPMPRVHSVFIVDGPKPIALLTPELIARINELENPTSPLMHGPVLVGATYVGAVKESIARFDAVYELHATKDQDVLLLPLSGVQLLDQTLLDGTLVYPTVHKSAYAIPVRGKGSHQLRLSFTARVTTSNDHLDLRFTVPKLAQNKLTLHWAKPVQAAHCLYCWGEEQRTTNAVTAVSKWEGQLGYENIVHLRWTGAVNPGLNAIEVREAHYWDLRPDSLALSSSLHYAIGKNSLGQLNVALPEGLQIRAADVQAIIPPLPSLSKGETAEVLSTSISIKNWYVTGKGAQRRLVVDFVQPISGNITLQLEIVPQTIAVQRQMSLPLPAPMQGKSVSGLLGYRLEATELRTTVQNLSVQGMSVPDFEQAWKKQNPRTLIAPPSRAYNFQRKAQQAGLELVIQSAVRQAECDMKWKIDLHHADLLGKVTITSPFEDLTMVEFFVDPSLTLADVVGPDVQRWSLSESNLQVWLRSTSKRVNLELVGWRTLLYKALPGKGSFPLPCVYPLHMQSIIGTVALETAPGLEIDVEHLRRLRPYGNEKHRYQIESTPYEASLSLRATGKSAFARTITKIHGTDQGIDFTYDIRISSERGSVLGFTVLVKNLPAEALTLEVPGAAVQAIKSKPGNTSSWSVKYPPGSPQEVAVTIRGRIANDRSSQVSLPAVGLDTIPIRSSYVLWKDVECAQADTGRKIIHQPMAKDEIAAPLGWSVAQAPRSLKVTLPKSMPRADVRILSARQSIAQDDRSAWTYSMECWVQAVEATEMRLRFPAQVEQLGAWLDHRMIPLRNPGGDEFLLALPASLEPRYVQLRWKYAASSERGRAPRLAPLALDFPPPSNTHMLWIPPGMVAAENQKPAVPTLLEHLLAEAESHLQFTALLASEALKAEDNPTRRILAQQQQFYTCVQQAEYTIKSTASQFREFDAPHWQTHIDALKKKNGELAKERRYERQRDSAEKTKTMAWSASPFREAAHTGIPWKLEPNQAGPILQSVQSSIDAERRMRTEWLLLGAVFLLVFSYFRHGISLLSKVWPETVLGLVLLVLWYDGIHLVGILIVACMLLVRCNRVRNAWNHRAIVSKPTAESLASDVTKMQKDSPQSPLP